MLRNLLIAYLLGFLTCGAFVGFAVYVRDGQIRDELAILSGDIHPIKGAFNWAVDFSKANWQSERKPAPVRRKNP